MKKINSHTVKDSVDKIRLSDYLNGIFHEIPTRKGVKKAIMNGYVKVNGSRGFTADYITGGEHIELFERKPQSESSKLNMDLEVLFEDDHLAIIYKPAGIIVSGNKKRAIENALSNNLLGSKAVDKLPSPEPAHRLDHPTSGALLIGKTRSCITALNQLFEKREIEKTYHAITIGEMDNKGIVDTEIKGKKAYTEYEVIQVKKSDKYGGLNLVMLKPKTGRRHQLRVHLSSIGSPIFGDKEYGIEDKISSGNGLYLHASSLKFKHPMNEEIVNVKTPMPKKFMKIFPESE